MDLKSIFLIFVLGIFIWGCSPAHTAAYKNLDLSSESSNLIGENGQVSEADSIAMFAQTLHPVLVQSCGSCHGGNQFPLHAVSNPSSAHSTINQNRLVDFANIESSRLVVKIRGGHQNIANTVADEIATQIQAWLDLMIAANPGGGGDLPIDLPEMIPLTASFKSIHANILLPKCVGCHNPLGQRPGEDYTDFATTIATGEVTPGDPQDSAMFTECVDGSMPEGASPLSGDELEVIEQWILDGAPNN